MSETKNKNNKHNSTNIKIINSQKNDEDTTKASYANVSNIKQL